MSRIRSFNHAPRQAIPLIAVLAVLALLTITPSASAVKFKAKGGGWGHGIGMSQWGTQGYAQKGKGYRWILGHYYQGTKVGQADSKRVRVLVGAGLGSVTFSGADRACGTNLASGKTYSASQSGGKVRLHNPRGNVKQGCGSKLVAKGGSSLVIGQSAYRGKLVVRPSGGGVNAINHVSLDDYVMGVVPNESPSSWEMDALRSQAVAARSYVLATGVGGDGYDAYDDTRSQVYGGKATEQASTNKAVRQTAGEVVLSGGKVAATYYFSTSGGQTEAIEHAWGSAPQAHLKSEKDPYDDLSPYHRWKITYTRAELEAGLGDWVKGKLRKVKILKTGDSPRIVRAKVVGSAGSTIVSGSDIQIRLGLRSTWVRFVRIDGKKRSGGGGSTEGGDGSGGGGGGGGGEDTGGTGGALAVGEGLDRDPVVGLTHPELVGGTLVDLRPAVTRAGPLDLELHVGDRAVDRVVLGPLGVGVDPADEVLARRRDAPA